MHKRTCLLSIAQIQQSFLSTKNSQILVLRAKTLDKLVCCAIINTDIDVLRWIMRCFKKMIALLLLGLMVFSLTSCDTSDDFPFAHLLEGTDGDYDFSFSSGNTIVNAGNNYGSGGSYGSNRGSASCYRCAMSGYDICQGHTCTACFRGGRKCAHCGGDGDVYKSGRGHVKCSYCSGMGQVKCIFCDGRGVIYH